MQCAPFAEFAIGGEALGAAEGGGGEGDGVEGAPEIFAYGRGPGVGAGVRELF